MSYYHLTPKGRRALARRRRALARQAWGDSLRGRGWAFLSEDPRDFRREQLPELIEAAGEEDWWGDFPERKEGGPWGWRWRLVYAGRKREADL